MAGIYLHIPFCRQACHYCNFHFTTSLRYKDELLEAMKNELADERGWLQGETVHTIYFGGGTPSLLSAAEIEQLLLTVNRNYPVAHDAEITLEANPDDLSADKLKDLASTGINRLSLGVQSFHEAELQWMNRAHNAREAITALEMAIQYFNNITIDLIYGSPLLTDEMWEDHVQRAIAMGIPHLSCYALTVEERTPLHKMIRNKSSVPVDQDKQARQFLLLMEWMSEAGYEHYEVSNFARPGFRSRHNSAYWKGTSYLGIGPSAHSYNGSIRRWNVANNQIYIKSISGRLNAREQEVLNSNQKLNEYLMISLRTMEGIELDRIRNEFGGVEEKRIREGIRKFMPAHVTVNNNRIRLTREGMLMADGIAADLFK